jgi:5,10-methenyltetrahydrofolate synthetase
MHELGPEYLGLAPEPDAQQSVDVARWRKAERERLIAARLALAVAVRRRHDRVIAAGLDRFLGDVAGRVVAVYWPFRGEPDLRFWMKEVLARGGVCALPVVAARARPLVFRRWRPGVKMARGVWNIPVPAADDPVTPDIVIAPVVGFDRACYRLGYGGGFYDRTLAALPCRPRAVGVGYSLAAIPSIYPQPTDIAMDAVITECARATVIADPHQDRDPSGDPPGDSSAV